MQKSTAIKKIMLLVIFLVLALVVFLFVSQHEKKLALPPSVAIDTRNQPTLGNSQATLHIVAFEDLKCANYMRFNKELLPQIEKKYIENGKANYTVINLAFIAGSIPAANAARCVYDQSNAAFFDYVSYIYAHQPPEDQDWATVPTLMLYAAQVPNIDSSKLANCIVSSPYTQLFSDNLALAIKTMGENVSTPSVYINGVKVDPLTWDHFKSIADQLE